MIYEYNIEQTDQIPSGLEKVAQRYLESKASDLEIKDPSGKIYNLEVSKHANGRFKEYADGLNAWREDPFNSETGVEGYAFELIFPILLDGSFPNQDILPTTIPLDFPEIGSPFQSFDIMVGKKEGNTFTIDRGFCLTLNRREKNFIHQLLGIPIKHVSAHDIFGQNTSTVLIDIGSSDHPIQKIKDYRSTYTEQISKAIRFD